MFEEDNGKIKLVENVIVANEPVDLPFINWTGVDVINFLGRINIKDVNMIIKDESEESRDGHTIVNVSSSQIKNWIGEPLPTRRAFR